jgi:hypothetical protein
MACSRARPKKGEVVEGELKAGDIAKKGDVASLIISSGDKCK